MQIKFILIVILILFKNTQEGPAFLACELACSNTCAPFSVLGLPGLAAYMACMTPCTALCLGTCFSSTTRILTVKENLYFLNEIGNIKADDYVVTLNSQNEKIITKVLRNLEEKGNFDFISITTEKSHQIEVTPDHGFIVFDKISGKLNLLKAKNLKLGDELIVSGNLSKINSIEHTTRTEKWTLETTEGTVLANEIYVSTICKQDMDQTLDFELAMKEWKQNHKNLINRI